MQKKIVSKKRVAFKNINIIKLNKNIFIYKLIARSNTSKIYYLLIYYSLSG